MITEYRLMPWTHSCRYNDGISDAFTKLKAKVKALAEDFKRLSTAKKVAIILGMAASIIGGAIAAIKVGKHQKAKELIKNAEQKLNEAQYEATRCAESLNSAINSNNISNQQAAKASNEINQLNTLNKETKKIKRLIEAIKNDPFLPIRLNNLRAENDNTEANPIKNNAPKRENSITLKTYNLNFDPANNNYEPINIKTKFKISSNSNPISAIQKAKEQARLRHELRMDLIAKKNAWDFIFTVMKLTRDLHDVTPEHINHITELLDKTLQKVKDKHYVFSVIERLAPRFHFSEYRKPILRLAEKYGYSELL
jgi:outer membrane lipopolysaccharide assembly protein LptE/RlpB